MRWMKDTDWHLGFVLCLLFVLVLLYIFFAGPLKWLAGRARRFVEELKRLAGFRSGVR